jgi:surface carbohydrate biosynthesis protein
VHIVCQSENDRREVDRLADGVNGVRLLQTTAVSASKPTLIIPVEIQVRELDSKLLLACIAAQRGFESILGHRTQVDDYITRFPRGTYLSKSMTHRSTRMFRILRKLGHEIGVWDEEALVYPSVEHYFRRRMSSEALAEVSFLFAWGRDNAELFRKYPGYDGTPIDVTGHPRIDLLRPELRGFFADDVRRLHDRHGRFALLNTNFSKVNGFRYRLDASGVPSTDRGSSGEAGSDLSPGYLGHKRALFDAFRAVVPEVASSLRDRTLIVRPHPNERPEPWLEAAAAHGNVEVVHDGNVIPWLLAADAVVHNGCTTAIEAYALGRPVVSYRPVKANSFDSDLPNSLGHECERSGDLCAMLERAARGELPCAPPPVEPRPIEEYIGSLGGSLACDRVVDFLSSQASERKALRPASLLDRLQGRLAANRRSRKKRRAVASPIHHVGRGERHEKRFPGVAEADLRDRIARLDACLGRFGGVRVEPVAEHVYRIEAE